MAHGYLDVYAWAAAVKKAGTFDRQGAQGRATLAFSDVGMGETKFANNQSLVQTAYVGQLLPSGQFKILWQSKGPVARSPTIRSRSPAKPAFSNGTVA
jgi:urea transport system substrate-binding protein